MEIIEFLRARVIDEKDRARYASEAHPTDSSWWAFTEPLTQGHYQATRRAFRHIDKHSPRQVIAECAAKTRIINVIEKQGQQLDPINACLVRCLAAPYQDHPDYREEWAPGM
ncbi:DUF6221 family protein [Pseudarthrobacter sp. YS3]|uniref:DUF6221 family protein n=1 Tax=Pseudarthrobacter sp. YS3 TaxID=3453718 RepID=UPI003EEDF649